MSRAQTLSTLAQGLVYDGTSNLTVGSITVGRGAGGVSTNTAVGASALAANTTGAGNTAFGASALNANNTASFNTAIGANALASNTTGDRAVAVGDGALALNTTGQRNVAVGRSALAANTTGNYNIGIGGLALGLNTTGSYNIAQGYQALYSNTTANSNTAVGYQAGYNNTTGPLNVFVGRQAGYSNTVGQGSVLIGYQAGYLLNDTASSSTDNTFVGSYAGYNVTTGSKNTFIGGSIQNGGAGYLMTTGSKNTIIGGYTGNQNGVNITTLSNYVVLSDGDGYPAFWGQGGSSGYMKLEAGRLEFPATQNASSNANTLDDYEEGTFTPTINLLGTLTYSNRFGLYQKVGKFVRVQISLAVSSTDSTQDGSAMEIGGLPFTVWASGSDYANGAFAILSEGMRGTQSPTAQNTFFGLARTNATTVAVIQNNYNSTLSGRAWFGQNARSGYVGGTMYLLLQFTYEASA